MLQNASRKGSRKGSAQLKGEDLTKAARRTSVSAAETQMEGFLEKKATVLTESHKFQSRYFVVAGHYFRYYADKQSMAVDQPKGMFNMYELQVYGRVYAKTRENDERERHTHKSSKTAFLRAASQDQVQLDSADPRVFHMTFSKGVSTFRAKSAQNAQLWINHLHAAATNAEGAEGNSAKEGTAQDGAGNKSCHLKR